MNFAIVFKRFSSILMVLAVIMILPIPIALAYGEYNLILPFLAPVGILFGTGAMLSLIREPKTPLTSKTGFLIVGLSWIVISLFGALPFFLSGAIPSYIDCFFETVSGFTTTGATILSEVESLPKALLFWRSFTHWMGGMGVLVFIMAVLPLSDNRSFQIMKAEVPGPKVSKLVARLRSTALLLYGLYFALTLIMFLFLVCGGMNPFDSACNAFATAGTGGFAVKDASIAAYDSVYFDVVITVFMLLFSVNFNLYFFILFGSFRQIVQNSELKWFLSIVGLSTAVITVDILPRYGNVFRSLRYSSFQVASIISTTGFCTADFDQWPELSKTILVALMFIGACAGSTGGGLKVSRVMLLIKVSLRELRRTISPRRVVSVHEDGKPVDIEVLHGTANYFALYCILFVLFTVLLAADNCSFTTAFTAVAACYNNIGPGLEKVGAVGNYGFLSNFSKIILSYAMLAGRLEIYPMLILFTPNAWKK